MSLVPELSPEREKILLGLNFYGYDFTSSTMDGKNDLDHNGVHTYTYPYSIITIRASKSEGAYVYAI